MSTIEERVKEIVAVQLAVRAESVVNTASFVEDLGAVNARIVGGEPIVRGPDFKTEVAELVRALVAAARA